MDDKKTSRLTEWRVCKHPGDWCNLMGLIYNDDRFHDGTMVSTSRLESIDFKTMKAETKNTIYNLE